MSHPEAPPTSGLVAGKYQLVALIGRGGMGSVWRAKHASLGTSVAIKFIEAEYASSQEARTRFDREAHAAATIQSKHAIQIFDHGVTEDGKPFIVMELLEGEPLDKRIEQRRLSLYETARILQQVCRGLTRAHEQGIVHRDLKPENIFLVKTPDDDDEVAKVLDFGVAKIKSQDNELGPSTKTGAVLGTPFFMSPEQARGLRNVDHRTDVWSLGVIAYRCIVGTLPFDGESVGDLLVKICTAPLPVPSQVAPGAVDAAFDAWFFRALERDPSRRFGSAQELSDALAQVAGIAVRGPTSRQTSSANLSGPGFATAQAGSGPQNGPVGSTGTPAAYTPPTLAQAPLAAVTASPLSSSQFAASGLPARGTYIAVAAGLGLLVAAIGGGVVYKLRASTQENVVSAGGPPPASSLPTALAATSAPTAPQAPATPALDPKPADASVKPVRLTTEKPSEAPPKTKQPTREPVVTQKPPKEPAKTPSPVVVAPTKPAQPQPAKPAQPKPGPVDPGF